MKNIVTNLTNLQHDHRLVSSGLYYGVQVIVQIDQMASLSLRPFPHVMQCFPLTDAVKEAAVRYFAWCRSACKGTCVGVRILS